MQPFRDVTHGSEARDDALRTGARIWRNDRYQVYATPVAPLNDETPQLVWLSIKRIDQQWIHDWRELQEIKNALVGPECEGVELYPAESRLVDTSNQYHLWVITDPEFRWPFGYTDRSVMSQEDLMNDADPRARRAVQRPFDSSRAARRRRLLGRR